MPTLSHERLGILRELAGHSAFSNPFFPYERYLLSLLDEVEEGRKSKERLDDEQLLRLTIAVDCNRPFTVPTLWWFSVINELYERRKAVEIHDVRHEDHIPIVGWECPSCHLEIIVPAHKAANRLQHCCHCGVKLVWV